jgi:SAM-dependent methyltransferase
MWFDGQADQFDASAGLEPPVGQTIAGAILQLVGGTGDERILDVGAGTGTIGQHFAKLPSRYLGLDRSWPMLEMFRRKLEPWPPHLLVLQADCDRPWPISDQAVTAVFASRAAHHLQIPHFVHEVFRVCRGRGYLLLGKVTRDADSLPSQLQRYKQSLLAEHHLETQGGESAVQQIVDRCCARGATPLPPIPVTQWTRTTTPSQLLARWERKPQLTSRVQANTLNAGQRAAILNALADWAQQAFGDLERPIEFSEAYTVQGVRLP